MTIMNRRDALKIATIGAATVAGSATASTAQVGAKLEGTWKYQSFRPKPGSLAADPKDPTFVLWSPADRGVVTIDPGGTTGNLVFTGTMIRLELKIQVTEGSPARLSASAVMKLPKGQFTNELQGWLVPARLGEDVGRDNPFVVRGSIVQTSADIARVDPQPIYTTGFFVMQRMP